MIACVYVVNIITFILETHNSLVSLSLPPSLSLLVAKRTMLGQKKSFWGVVESFERSTTEFYESVTNVRSIPGIKLIHTHTHTHTHTLYLYIL